jgi:hypothetical protein
LYAEITLAFEDDGPNIIIKSNGPLGRGMGVPRPENDFQQFKQFTAVHFVFIFVVC